MYSSLLLHIRPGLENSTQKEVMSLQGGATHPLPLSDQSRTTDFRTGMEILRRVIKHTKFIQSAINYPSHGQVFKFTIINEEEQIKNAKLDGTWFKSSPLFVLFPTFCFLVSNSKGSALADPNKCSYFKIFILLLQESSLLPLQQEEETSPQYGFVHWR